MYFFIYLVSFNMSVILSLP